MSKAEMITSKLIVPMLYGLNKYRIMCLEKAHLQKLVEET